MLKFLKGVLIVVGIIIAVAMIILMVVTIFKVNAIYGVYSPSGGGSASLPAGETPDPNPWLWIVLTSLAGIIGGFAIGFGLGIPKRTFKNRLKDAAAADAEPAN